MDERISTPRGNFKIRFSSMKEARENGFGFWFEHEGFQIVGDGIHAFAVAKEGKENEKA